MELTHLQVLRGKREEKQGSRSVPESAEAIGEKREARENQSHQATKVSRGTRGNTGLGFVPSDSSARALQ